VQAVRQAARVLAAERAAGMLVVPADLPSIQRSDIERIALGHGSAPTVTLVGAAKDGGTNALACSPPDLLPICFGDDSFRRHHAAAMALGVVPKIPVLPRFGRDIDRPGDLYAFLEQPSTTRAFAYLTDSGIARRLLELRELPGLRKLPEPRLPQRPPERAPTCFSAFTFGATAALSPE